MSTQRQGQRRLGVWRIVIALCVGALLLTACGKGGSGSSSKTKLPGLKEFGLNEQQFADHVEKTQALIASCMSAAGFEYVPVDVQTIEAAQARVRKEPGYTRRTFKEKWGLAITTRFDNPVRDTGMGTQNLRIFKSLTKPNQVAYMRTLWGDDPKADFVFTLDEEDFSGTGGCTRQAVSKVFTKAQLEGTYVNPRDVIFRADKRIAAARQAWTNCMHAAGFNYVGDQDEIISDYEKRLEKLLDGQDPTTLTGERLAALRKLQKDEIAVSLVDLDCQLKYTDKIYNKVETEVYGHPLD